jgi:hypothetical protein
LEGLQFRLIVRENPFPRNYQSKWTGGVPQAVELLLCKLKAQNSNPSPTSKKKKKVKAIAVFTFPKSVKLNPKFQLCFLDLKH